jgi:hypothetical protein
MTRRLGVAVGCAALLGTAFALGARVATREASVANLAGSPAERVGAALAEVDPLARASALLPALRDLRGEDVKEVVNAYEASFASGGGGGTALQLLCEAWAGLDPVGALDRMQHWPAERRSEGVPALLRAWARREPVAARHWAEGVVDEGEALRAMLTGWSESGDPEIWDFVMDLPPNMDRESASILLMQQIVARGGFDDLLARVEALPDEAPGRFKLAAFRTATGLVADHDPALALAFADRHANGPYDKGLLRRVAVRWVQSDGPAAMKELLDRPAAVERDWALREAYRRWLRRDRPAALAWMPDAAARDPSFDPLCEVYAVALARTDPQQRERSIARAVRWSEDIANADTRRETQVELGVLWLHFEPEAARPWLDARGLEAEVRSETARRRQLLGRESRDASTGSRRGAARPPD